MPLLILFIVIPLVELAVILKVSSFIGIFWTLLLIILTAVIGVKLLRQQGLSTLMRAGQKLNDGQIPAQELAEGFLLALAGALLLTPGFVTDAAGFSLLMPSVRKRLIGNVIGMIRPKVMTAGGGFGVPPQYDNRGNASGTGRDGRKDNVTIEGEYTKDD